MKIEYHNSYIPKKDLDKLKKEIERLEEENCIMRDTLNRYGIEPSNGKEW